MLLSKSFRALAVALLAAVPLGPVARAENIGTLAAQMLDAASEGTSRHLGEVLNLLGIWRGASFACDSANGLGEPSKGAPHGDETTCFAAHA